jgi:hypothetical protein
MKLSGSFPTGFIQPHYRDESEAPDITTEPLALLTCAPWSFRVEDASQPLTIVSL